MAKGMKLLGSETATEFANKIVNGVADYKFIIQYGDKKGQALTDPKDLARKEDYRIYNARIARPNKDGFVAEVDEYDHIVIENISGEDIDEQIRVITESFANVDFKYEKNQGNGKITITDVVGERPTATCIHEDGIHGIHLHIKCFRYTLDKEKLKASPIPLSDSRCLEAQFEYTNKKLEEANLPKLSFCIQGTTNQYNKPTQETKKEAREVFSGKDVNEVLENITLNSENQVKAINQSVESDVKKLENAMQQVKNIQLEIAAKQASIKLVDDNRSLIELNKSKDIEISKLNENIQGLESNIEELIENHQIEIEEKDVAFKTELALKNDEIKKLNEDISSLNSELETSNIDRDNAFNEIKIKDEIIIDLGNSLNDKNQIIEKLNLDLEQSKQIIDGYKDLTESQKQQIESLKEFQKNQALQIQEQQEFIKKQQEELKENAEMLSKQKEEFIKLQEFSKQQQIKIEENEKAYSALENRNSRLEQIAFEMSNIVVKIKTSCDDLVSSIKDKFFKSPAIKKNFNEIFGGVDKEQQNLYKEIDKVVNLAEKENININKNLIDSNKPKVEEQKTTNGIKPEKK